MTDTTTRFFDDLHTRGHERLLAKATGTLRFDLSDGDEVETWVVGMDRGDIAVSRDEIEPTCRVLASRKLFDGLVTGRVNAMSAMLRGEVTYAGDAQLLMMFQRILPGPTDKGDAR